MSGSDDLLHKEQIERAARAITESYRQRTATKDGARAASEMLGRMNRAMAGVLEAGMEPHTAARAKQTKPEG